MRLLLLLCLVSAALGQTYDLVLKGGHVIDPRNGVDTIADVAIAGTRIAAVGPNLPVGGARKVVDVSGLYVTPGLVDIHAHVYAGIRGSTTSGGHRSIYPDHIAFRTGVTTVVDPGSAGWRSFEEFRRTVIDVAETRVLAMLNIVGIGILSYDLEQNVEDMSPRLTADMALKHKDVVVGVKSAHWWAPDFISVEKAVEAGKLADIPVMVDFGYFLKERPYEQMVTEILRPGDMSTHCYRWPAPLLDEQERVRPYLLDARKRGVKFDVGHGGGSFHFRNAEPAVKQGFWPDSISTDLHTNSLNGSAIDMPNVMSKFLALGVPLAEVIRMSTTNPATQVKRPELGQIAVGAEADIAVLHLENGRFGFADVAGGRIEGNRRLSCEMTLRAGKIVFDFNARAAVPWREGNLRYPEK
jgi:dihydroorotase